MNKYTDFSYRDKKTQKKVDIRAACFEVTISMPSTFKISDSKKSEAGEELGKLYAQLDPLNTIGYIDSGSSTTLMPLEPFQQWEIVPADEGTCYNAAGESFSCYYYIVHIVLKNFNSKIILYDDDNFKIGAAEFQRDKGIIIGRDILSNFEVLLSGSSASFAISRSKLGLLISLYNWPLMYNRPIYGYDNGKKEYMVSV